MNKTTEALKLAEEALNAMLTHMGMDEDEWTKPTFNQAHEALAAIREALAEPQITTPDVCGEVCARAKLCYGCGKAFDEALAEPVREPVAYVTEPQNVLPNGLTLLQTNPDCAVQLNAGRDFGWLYVKGADGQWVTDRKLSPEEINEAQDQAADMVVLKMESVLEKMFAAPITTPPTAALAARQMRDAAVNVLRELEEQCKDGSCGYVASEAIAALPVPEVQWRDLTDDEILGCLLKWRQGEYELQIASAAIAKFKEKNK